MGGRGEHRTGARWPLLFALLLPAALLASGCSCSRTATPGPPGAGSGPPTLTPPPATSTPPPATSTPPPPQGYTLTTPSGPVQLTAAQLAGQRVIYSYKGLVPPSDLLAAIRKGEAAGVIFHAYNVEGLDQIRHVIDQLQEAAQSPGNPVRAPLLLMTDQEGGKVSRLPGGPKLSEKQIGASADPVAEATKAGTEAGTLLASVGMNVNLAPVLDVYRQEGDFDDSLQRSYSTDPAVVARLGLAFIAAQQKTGVFATVKHFPGLGSATTAQNTDARPVKIATSVATLRAIDEVPFAQAIGQADVRLVMVSWAQYPSMASRPAGLSEKVVETELRSRFDFRGVTITDGLRAHALDAYGSFGNRAVLAAGAGMDLVLCADAEPSLGLAARAGLQAALEQNRLGAARFTAAAQRVVDLRYAVR